MSLGLFNELPIEYNDLYTENQALLALNPKTRHSLTMSLIYRALNIPLNLLSSAVDLILPPRCIGSGNIVDSSGMVSPAFWQELHFIAAPYCDLCGTPFSLDITEGSLCAACIETEPVFDQARAAIVYNDASRKAVLDFKYGDRLHAVKTFVPWMERAGTHMIAACDIVLPVPLHPRRLWQRRFNQAGILAQSIAKKHRKIYLPDVLRRTRFTSTQKGLSRKERHMNVRNAFTVPEKHMPALSGKAVVLIDDVFTSGATLNECARTLKNAGVKTVHVLTIARVTRDDAFADH